MEDPQQTIVETIKTTFQHTFKTGNILIDTMINATIIMVAGFAATGVGTMLQDFSLRGIFERFLNFFGVRRQEIIITGMITRTDDKHWPTFSQRFKAVLYQIKKLKLKDSKINGLREIKIDNETDFFVSQSMYFTFAPGVYGYIWNYEREKSGQSGKSYTEEQYTVQIYSWGKTLQELKDVLDGWEQEYQQSFVKQSIVLKGKTMKSKDGWGAQTFDFSDRFFAVLHKISTLDHGDSASDLVELHLREPSRLTMESNDAETPEHLRRQISRLLPKNFKINEDVVGEIDWSEDKLDGSMHTSVIYYTISIFSTTLSSKQLSALVSTWEKEYEDFKFAGNGLRYYTYSPVQRKSSKEESIPTEDYNEFCFESGKTFDNVFFAQKQTVVSRIEFFLKNEDWYAERGIPYTLGFLFHGLPGCGKTSTIKAIANMTQRHIVSVPLKNIKNIEDLYNVFYSNTINKKPVPINRRIYVLEDIDAASMEDTVKRRNEEEAKSKDDSSTDSDSMDEQEDKDSKKKKMKKKRKEKKNQLTLSDLLEVFDGVMEMKGRIMVITTNHPEKLDPALVRPGRIDVNMKFGKCRPEDIFGIFKNFYGNSSLPENFSIQKLPWNCWTPAETIQVFLNNMENPEMGLETICTEKPGEVTLTTPTIDYNTSPFFE